MASNAIIFTMYKKLRVYKITGFDRAKNEYKLENKKDEKDTINVSGDIIEKIDYFEKEVGRFSSSDDKASYANKLKNKVEERENKKKKEEVENKKPEKPKIF